MSKYTMMMPWMMRHTAGCGLTIQVAGPCRKAYPAEQLVSVMLRSYSICCQLFAASYLQERCAPSHTNTAATNPWRMVWLM